MLLMDIDKHKYLVTLQEEQATGLTQALDEVLEVLEGHNLNGFRDKDASIRIAGGALHNFFQRFYWSASDSEDSSWLFRHPKHEIIDWFLYVASVLYL